MEPKQVMDGHHLLDCTTPAGPDLRSSEPTVRPCPVSIAHHLPYLPPRIHHVATHAGGL
jgi:hypothetical protein